VLSNAKVKCDPSAAIEKQPRKAELGKTRRKLFHNRFLVQAGALANLLSFRAIIGKPQDLDGERTQGIVRA